MVDVAVSPMQFKTIFRFVFQHLPEPNRACLVGVYAFLIWNNLWPGIPDSYQNLPESDSGSFRYTRSRDYQTPTRHALLGSGRCWKTTFSLLWVGMASARHTDVPARHTDVPVLRPWWFDPQCTWSKIIISMSTLISITTQAMMWTCHLVSLLCNIPCT